MDHFFPFLRIVTACMALANIVKSSLGPVGLDKMLVSNRKKMGAHKNLRKFLQFELAPPNQAFERWIHFCISLEYSSSNYYYYSVSL